MAKVLVTGTAGFIGFHLANLLHRQGHEVVGLDMINDYYDPNLKLNRLAFQGIDKSAVSFNQKLIGKSGISFIQLKLEDKENVFELFKAEKFDYVVHLAAQAGVRYSITNPEVYISSNITGFLNILEACRAYPVKHLVFASTSSVYGLNTKMPFNENHVTDQPMSLYAATKKSNELMAHTYAHLFGIPATGLRFFTVYGPWGRPDMALFLFTDAIIKGNKVNVFNNGQMIRDFTYVGDIVESIKRLITQPSQPNADYNLENPASSGSTAPYRIFNIGNNSPVNLMDYLHEIENCLGKKADINYMPMQAGDVSMTFADSSALYNAVGFKPNTTIQTGIKNFIDWYLDYYKVSL